MTSGDETANAGTTRTFFGQPIGLSTLFLTEMWERFSFYGLRPLLVLFMSAALLDGGFGFDRMEASAIVGIYAASVYLSSLPGGWIADRWLGLRKAVMIGAVLISLGHISIGISAFEAGKVAFFVGLVLIVLGTGLLKPNISAMVGELYPEGGERRDAGFSIFYMGINIGSLAGQFLTGFLGESVGWHWGFGAAGVGMLIGLAVFVTRSKATLGEIGNEVTIDPDPAKQARQVLLVKATTGIGIAAIALVIFLVAVGTIQIDAVVWGEYFFYFLGAVALAYFLYIFTLGGLTKNEMKRMAVIAVLFVFASIFWAAFEQAPTSLNLFAKDFTVRTFMGFEVPATWFQTVNSAFIIILAPVFAWLWIALGKRKINLSSPLKFAIGLAFAGLGFLFMIFAANIVVGSGGTTLVSPWWLVCSYFFQSAGELCLSPVGLSSMTKLSPKRFVGQMLGIWFLASAIGNLVAGLVGGNVDPNKLEQMPALFSATTFALFASAIILGLLSIPIAKMMKNRKGADQDLEIETVMD
ncbi:MAG: peptide MFS transporter [Pyrinomonadaceae bacterium]